MPPQTVALAGNPDAPDAPDPAPPAPTIQIQPPVKTQLLSDGKLRIPKRQA
ncbi:MAG: hypothetical protein HKN82_16910 [Akkermansiaceae bacterium]|nr:hypothetical protein [Akkermansiaceae bacterium]